LRLKIDTMRTRWRFVNRFVRRIKCFPSVLRSAAAAESRDLPLCSMAGGRFPGRRGSIVDNAWKGKQKFRDFRTKQRLTTKGAATYKPRLPENAGATSSVDMLR